MDALPVKIMTVDGLGYRKKLTELERLVFSTFEQCKTDQHREAWEHLTKRSIREFKTIYCTNPSKNDLFRIEILFKKIAKKHSHLLDIEVIV